MERYLSFALNVLVIGMLIVVLVVWGQRMYGTPGPQPTIEPAVLIKEGVSAHRIGLPQAEGRRVIVLALSALCRFCNEGLPFYKQVFSDCAGADTAVVVAFQENEREVGRVGSRGDGWLRVNGLPTDSVRYVDLASAGIPMVPTIIHVDARGTVRNVWIGILAPTDESSIIDCCRGRQYDAATPAQQSHRVRRYTRADLERRPGLPLLIDTRPREAGGWELPPFAVRHIPAEELDVRALTELDRRSEAVVNCLQMSLVECYSAVTSLKRLGFDVAVLEAKSASR